MNYIGEHLLPGQLGHFCVVLSFVAALLATISYYYATKHRGSAASDGWLSLGRFSFLLHGIATFCIIGVLFYILTGKMYEYQYAWANVSDDLPMQYVFSAFWKEQQGSFLLWSFWHIGLSIVLMLRAGKWEAPVMTMVALAEVIIASMLLGLYFGDFRLGASPFDLLRDTMDAPIFNTADYLTKIKGNGLNPLLQNYWMTIHPPTLFLGFASTIVPFAYAISGLWLREHTAWLKPALGWAYFSGAILGTGILMGGAWAYEALSFAGYWAWDPVENASLVPWITLVAGIHTNLVARATGYSIRSTYGFYILTFVLILYSTYLTRSGVLGDTSVHSFTEMGLGYQLILLFAGFAALGLWLWVSRYKEVPDVTAPVQQKTNKVVAEDGAEVAEAHTEIHKKTEESTTSREFWMFIGALVLLFSAVLITGATSLPVFNKIVQIFNPDYVGAALRDPVEHHNRYQLWIAVFIGFLSAIAQFTRYNERNWKGRWRKFALHIGIAAVIAALLSWYHSTWIEIRAWQLYTLLFAAMFTVAANLDYLITVAKGNIKMASAAISHVGFGILILGVLSTGLGKSWISTNKFMMQDMIEGASSDDVNKNVILLRDAPMAIKGFDATYLKDTVERQTRTFSVEFTRKDEAGNPTGEQFTLYPNVMYDRQFSKVVANNPSTQHYWNYDVFTLITSLPKAELDLEFAKRQEDSLKYVGYEAAIGDTIFTKQHALILESITKSPKHPGYTPEKGDMAFGLNFRAYKLGEEKGYKIAPMMCFRPEEGAFGNSDISSQLQLKLRLTDASLNAVFKAEEAAYEADLALEYQTFGVKAGEAFTYKGIKVQLSNIVKDVKRDVYQPEEGDIAVGADLSITAPDGSTANAMPIYLIRGNQPYSLKDEVATMGLHLKFETIDPTNGVMKIGVAQGPILKPMKVPFELVEDAPRSDYVVLEAIIFPGINLVWVGSILMLLGLALSLWRKLR
jgi:cytochrome c-type biogenesis protein CcmF